MDFASLSLKHWYHRFGVSNRVESVLGYLKHTTRKFDKSMNVGRPRR